jgi:hypothetical protein
METIVKNVLLGNHEPKAASSESLIYDGIAPRVPFQSRHATDEHLDPVVYDDMAENCFSLQENLPNPFSANTKIEFRFADKTEAKLLVYAVSGALVRTLLDSKVEQGLHFVEWDGTDDCGNVVQSGVYFCRLYAGLYSKTREMIYTK